MMNQTSTTQLPVNSNPAPVHPAMMNETQLAMMVDLMGKMKQGADLSSMPKEASGSKISINIHCTTCNVCGPTRIEGKWSCQTTLGCLLTSWCKLRCCFYVMPCLYPNYHRDIYHFCSNCG